MIEFSEVTKSYAVGTQALRGVSMQIEDGEFVFGPLCPDRKYEIQVWVNRVKHVKNTFLFIKLPPYSALIFQEKFFGYSKANNFLLTYISQ